MKYEGTKIYYEVGDWVVGWHNENPDLLHNAWLIESFHNSIFATPKGHLDWNTGVENLRLATQKEIDDATKEKKIIVGADEVKFTANQEPYNGCTELRIGCVTVSKELFLKIAKKAGWL